MAAAVAMQGPACKAPHPADAWRWSLLPAMCVCREIQSHVSEPFWSIHVTYREPAAAAAAAAAAGGGGAQQQQQGARCEFNWARGRLFDGDAAALLYEAVTEEQPITATVMQVRRPCVCVCVCVCVCARACVVLVWLAAARLPVVRAPRERWVC
jgi:hypothetical protein